jgi:hypothetical protein
MNPQFWRGSKPSWLKVTPTEFQIGQIRRF